MNKNQMNKKRKMATALKYDGTDSAPRIIAKGLGERAERIIEKAKEHKVPVHVDTEVANVLVGLDIGDEIPNELYEVIATIIVYVMGIDKKAEHLK